MRNKNMRSRMQNKIDSKRSVKVMRSMRNFKRSRVLAKLQLTMVEEMKEYFKKTPRKTVHRNWRKLSYLDNVGPTVDEYLSAMDVFKKIRNR